MSEVNEAGFNPNAAGIARAGILRKPLQHAETVAKAKAPTGIEPV